MIPFGWSAGDLVNGINVIVRVAEAFKETGGAASKYQAHHDFAVGLKKTFASLKLYTDLHEHDGYSDDIAGQLKLIEKPWKRFQTFLEKYDEPLGEQSTMYKLKKAPRIVKWTAKDLSGEVEKLERAVHRPLESLNLLLSLAAFAGSSAAVISQQPRSTSKSPRQYQHFADFEGSDVRFDGSESNVPTSTAAPWRKKSRDLPAHSQGNPDSSDDDPRDSSPPSRLSARNQVRELKSEDEEDSSGNDSDDPDSGDASGLVSKRQRRRKRQLMPNRLDRKGRRNSFDEEEKARNSRYRKRYNGGDRSSSGAARPDEPWIPSKLRPDKFKPKRCPDDEPPAWRIR